VAFQIIKIEFHREIDGVRCFLSLLCTLKPGKMSGLGLAKTNLWR
jgi:hypothetical protein